MRQTFTAVVDHVELGPDHLKLIGYSYLWMFPIWGIAFYAAELEAKAMEKRNVPFYVRVASPKIDSRSSPPNHSLTTLSS